MGIQRVEEEILATFGREKVFSIDRDTTKSHRDAQKVAARFYETPGSILVGTEMALPYLTKSVSRTAVASLDSLLALPEWRAEERAFHILMNLRASATDELLIQTRHPDERIIGYAKDADTYGFYKEELARREKFGYPPFTLFISLSWQGTKAASEAMRKKLAETFKGYEFFGHVPPIAIPRKTKTSASPVFRSRALLRIERDEWPTEELMTLLSQMPPSIAIQVNPQELL